MPAVRERIEKAYGARVVDHAGATEVGPWGYADINGVGLHVNEGSFLAEFVENEATIAELRRADVDCAQGYGIQRPFALHRLMDYRPRALGE